MSYLTWHRAIHSFGNDWQVQYMQCNPAVAFLFLLSLNSAVHAQSTNTLPFTEYGVEALRTDSYARRHHKSIA